MTVRAGCSGTPSRKNHSMAQEQRLEILERLGLLNAQADPSLDRLTRIAAAALGAPVALFTVVAPDVQWLRSRVGWARPFTSLLESFCRHSLDGPDLLEVPDATLDARFRDNPLVTGPEAIRFYAGQPVCVDGVPVATLCVLDHVPRVLDEPQRRILADLAVTAGELVARRPRATAEMAGSLDAREARYHLLWQTTSDAVVMIDESGTILLANPAVETLFGIRPEHLVGGDLAVLQPPRLREAHRKAMARYLQTGQRRLDWRATETVGQHSDGHEFPIEVTFSDLLIDGRRVFAAGMRDISARKAQQVALQQSEERYRRIVETAVEGICIFDATGTVTFVNGTMVRMLGHDAQGMIGRPIGDFVHADFHARMRASVERRRRGVAEQMEFKLVRRDGDPMWAWVSVAPFFDAAGAFAGVLAMVSDITQRKQAEDALRAGEARFRALTELSTDWYWEQDDALRFRTLSGGRLGRGATELQFMIGRTFDECLVDAESERAGGAVLASRMAARERFFDLELAVGRADAAPIVLSVSGEPVQDADGRFAGYRGVARNLTDTRRAEAQRRALAEQLRQAQKMEAIGVLAGGIAHDFNNVLAAILANTVLAKDHAETGGIARESLDLIEKAGRRGRALVRQILTFAQRHSHEPSVVPLQPVVEETLALLKVALPAGMSLHADLAAEPIPVRIDASQIGQVLMNLGTNAWHAAGGKGQLQVRLARRALVAALPVATGVLPPGHYAELSVRDSGSGMSAETQKRIFEPFFTTKAAGEGTGLGLSVVHGLVLGHGGGIAVHSELGAGSTFTVFLPEADAAAAGPDAATTTASPRGAGQRILYVDDDEVLVVVVDRLLQRQGYRVRTFRDADEALRVIESDPAAFDLVLSDYHMPRLSGLDIARALRDAGVVVPVVLISGNLTPDLEAQARGLGIEALVRKENCVEDLAGVVHAVLSRREASAA